MWVPSSRILLDRLPTANFRLVTSQKREGIVMHYYTRFWIVTAILRKVRVFWGMTPCRGSPVDTAAWHGLLHLTRQNRNVQLFAGLIRELLRVCENIWRQLIGKLCRCQCHSHGHASRKQVVRFEVSRIEVAFTQAPIGWFICEQPPGRIGNVAGNVMLSQWVTCDREALRGRNVAVSCDM